MKIILKEIKLLWYGFCEFVKDMVIEDDLFMEAVSCFILFFLGFMAFIGISAIYIICQGNPKAIVIIIVGFFAVRVVQSWFCYNTSKSNYYPKLKHSTFKKLFKVLKDNFDYIAYYQDSSYSNNIILEKMTIKYKQKEVQLCYLDFLRFYFDAKSKILDKNLERFETKKETKRIRKKNEKEDRDRITKELLNEIVKDVSELKEKF